MSATSATAGPQARAQRFAPARAGFASFRLRHLLRRLDGKAATVTLNLLLGTGQEGARRAFLGKTDAAS